MDTLRKLFPLSFKKMESVSQLVIAVVIYVVIGIVASLLMLLAGLLTGWIPVAGVIIGWVLRIIGILVEAYVVGGIVLLFLHHFNVIKD
jgi:hypothetical protein